MAVPIQKLQLADKVLGLITCGVLQPLRLLPSRRGSGGGPRRILLIKFWGIGSLQLLVPAVLQLRARHPLARLTLVTRFENAEFAAGLGVFDEILTLDVRRSGWAGIARRVIRLMNDVRRKRFDLAVDFEFFTRFSSVIALCSGASERRGFQAPGVWRGGFHTHTQPFNRYWHVARNFRALAQGQGENEDPGEIPQSELTPFLVTRDQRERVSAILRTHAPGPAQPYIVLNPNAGELALERRWPPESFAALAVRLANDGRAVWIVGGPGERERSESIARAAEHQSVRSLAGELSIGELCALLDEAKLVVSNDSGPMHLSAALGTPTLGLFGPETPVMYAPIGERARFLWKPPICSPCINVHENKVLNCVHGRPECLVNISVDEVFAECRRLLSGDELRVVSISPAARRDTRIDQRIGG